MCGIIGIASESSIGVEKLVDGLDRLEYRGYDSAGVSYLDDGLKVTKQAGEIDELREVLSDIEDTFQLGIGHTRWSTHGAPTDANAHPHTDNTGNVAVVHNGIIENHDSLRRELRADGIEFTSQTDSEVIPHLVARNLQKGATPREAFNHAVDRLQGSFAVCGLIDGSEHIFVARESSPLTIGLSSSIHYVASDVPAFLEHTRNAVYLEEGQRGAISSGNYDIWNNTGRAVSPVENTINWSVKQTEKQGYEHFLLKEINDQPHAIERAIRDRVTTNGQLMLDTEVSIESPNTVHFVGCGTSYHACLYGAYLFRDQGISAYAYRGSEYGAVEPPVADSGGDLVVGISQSGETADILSALDRANNHGQSTLVITNVLGSTAIRKADEYFTIQAGPEVSVAATKTFTADLIVLNLLAERFTQQNHEELLQKLSQLPGWIRDAIAGSKTPDLAAQYADSDAVFYLGSGFGRPMALEGALKLKELSYKHAEGFGSGELKHGPLALITDNTPVIAVVTGDSTQTDRITQNINEAQARGAPVIAIGPKDVDVPNGCDHVISVPNVPPSLEPVLVNIHLQLFAYHLARELGRSIDKPRHLAKSVTVR